MKYWYCLILLCTTVVIAATRAHVGLLTYNFLNNKLLCFLQNLQCVCRNDLEWKYSWTFTKGERWRSFMTSQFTLQRIQILNKNIFPLFQMINPANKLQKGRGYMPTTIILISDTCPKYIRIFIRSIHCFEFFLSI